MAFLTFHVNRQVVLTPCDRSRLLSKMFKADIYLKKDLLQSSGTIPPIGLNLFFFSLIFFFSCFFFFRIVQGAWGVECTSPAEARSEEERRDCSERGKPCAWSCNARGAPRYPRSCRYAPAGAAHKGTTKGIPSFFFSFSSSPLPHLHLYLGEQLPRTRCGGDSVRREL